MKIKKITLAILGTITLSINSFAFENKDINSFKTLSEFKTVDEFENYFNSYTKECLDNGFGGRGSIPCFVSNKLWDKELNIYYKKLLTKLDSEKKELLKKLQRKWIETRDLTIELNYALLDEVYGDDGTMFALMSADDADSIMAPMIKQRALLLKKWYELKPFEIPDEI